ncbi:AbrB/MazE/SpoVT family DNA-binding domain-containing protein [Segnochrobactraceae bacterium EtOH-i3]
MTVRLTVSDDGHLTLGAETLRSLGLKPGDQVTVESLAGGGFSIRAAPTGAITDLFGMLKRPGQTALSIDEMNEAIAAG